MVQTAHSDSSDPINYKVVTDAMIFDNISTTYAVITYIDSAIRKAAIIFGIQKKSMIKYGKWPIKPSEGMILKMKFTEENGNIDILEIDRADLCVNLPYVKEVSRTVEMYG